MTTHRCKLTHALLGVGDHGLLHGVLGIACRKTTLRDGLGVYLIVPYRALEGVRQIAEQEASGRISVDSIEAFVGGNVDELSTFSRGNVVVQFRRLLETYNSRVNEIENDKAMMIEIPRAML